MRYCLPLQYLRCVLGDIILTSALSCLCEKGSLVKLFQWKTLPSSFFVTNCATRCKFVTQLQGFCRVSACLSLYPLRLQLSTADPPPCSYWLKRWPWEDCPTSQRRGHQEGNSNNGIALEFYPNTSLTSLFKSFNFEEWVFQIPPLWVSHLRWLDIEPCER